MVLGIRYPSHRLAFFYVHGFMPEIVDHINGDIKDNRIMNLRAATASQTGHNKFIASNNRSGFKGFSWSNQQRKWEAYITVNYKRTRLGFFRNKDDAAKAVMSAREKMVGEFANHQ
ncbi:MAG: HNH endonuclease [Enterobacter hormaechei]